ncbi:helix-turn-helix transcriptional regulator [Amycolatopsis solani]|uniref:helix-turn-helix transcriptional regulator n=1 Tax=Amycolatopsis solani TaxID=3028615 RepID=UPI0025AFAC00|nr:helix-turn-helix transcriptional regulator [Amycolatopsis sp. MEP2-6]
MRSTREVRRLAAVLLAGDADSRFYGEDLREAAHMHSNRLYPLLTLWLERGWVTDGWDGPSLDGSKRYYVLTDVGRRELDKP